ncbi:uncharacterized protein LOC123705351 [Colias croceus]|uniref:uncharacterized protein LOC123705351 n=1 Tax=Colias crocea TaxID=72248 RepID=UPI001E27C09B|nr:uncharacterized protein LOC123705351 [Colias croceus]
MGLTSLMNFVPHNIMWEVVAWCGVLVAALQLVAAAGSQEADPLQQALLLVDLLKTEYARVKGENIILRKRELQFRSSVDDETCPPTEPTDTISPITDGRRSGVQHGNLLTPHPVVSRRKLYKSRRQDYEDAFGPHPGGDIPKSTTTTTTSPKTETTTKQTLTSKSISITSSTSQSPKSKIYTTEEHSTAIITQQSFHTKLENPVKNELPPKKLGFKNVGLSHKKAFTKTTRDPVMEQVASEIMNEMKDFKTPKVKKYAFYSAPLLSPKTERMTKFENFTRGTMRIHQSCRAAGSALSPNCFSLYTFSRWGRAAAERAPAAVRRRRPAPRGALAAALRRRAEPDINLCLENENFHQIT